jgi:hypothetical protein
MKLQNTEDHSGIMSENEGERNGSMNRCVLRLRWVFSLSDSTYCCLSHHRRSDLRHVKRNEMDA